MLSIQVVRGIPMAFFHNRAINLLNLHYGIHCITLYGGGAFFLVYLLRAGLSIPGVLGSLSLILVGRFALRLGLTGLELVEIERDVAKSAVRGADDEPCQQRGQKQDES